MPSLTAPRKGSSHAAKTMRKAMHPTKTSNKMKRVRAKPPPKRRGHEKGKKLGKNQARTEATLNDLKAALKDLLVPASTGKKTSLDKVIAAWGGQRAAEHDLGQLVDALDSWSVMVNEIELEPRGAPALRVERDERGLQDHGRYFAHRRRVLLSRFSRPEVFNARARSC